MQIQDVFAAYADDMQELEKHIDKYLNSETKLIPEISHHLIDSGGKRLRPLLLLICSRLCGYRGADRFPLAAVMEFIHTASLLHDDVIDQATIRRGKTSANNIWGNAASVLVGDYLYSKAGKLLSEINVTAIMRLMSEMSNIMSEGEVFQLMRCGDVNLTEKEYLTIIEKKTAVLISAACTCGAILAAVSAEKVAALKQYGYKIGMAFQITDDTLDYMAKERDFGKTIGKDLEEGKITLPLIYALHSAPEDEREKNKALIASKEANEKVVPSILSLIQKYKGIDYSLQSAAKFINDAQSELAVFNSCPEKEHLHAVAQYVLARRI